LKAQSAVRELNAAGRSANIVVNLRAGTYWLRYPLVFTSLDGGDNNQSVTYRAWPGETVVLSGGVLVTNWVAAPDGIATAKWEAAKRPDISPRQLFVHGKRCRRARGEVVPQLTCSLDATNGSIRLGFAEGQMPPFTHPGDVEFVFLGGWDILRKKLHSVAPEGNAFLLRGPFVLRKDHPWNLPGKTVGSRFYFENAVELMDEPGEWCYESETGTLYYRLNRGEDARVLQAIVPVTEQLIVLAGTPKSPTQNLHFEGIQIQHTDWPLPEAGYYGIQAGVHSVLENGRKASQTVKAAIEAHYARWCSVQGCRIEHIGGAGLSWSDGCISNVARGNTITDVGNNGLMVGGKDTPDCVPRQNSIADNHVSLCGEQLPGCVGIWVGIADGTMVANNLVENLPYTGISVGWNWTTKLTNCKSNIIANNEIRNASNLFGDSGGLYLLGNQPGSVIRGNWIHDTNVRGLYFDEGSTGFLVESNLIENTPDCIYFNASNADAQSWNNELTIAALPAPGKRGKGLLCNGTGSGLLLDHANELEPKQLTVEAWVRPNTLQGDAVLVSKNGSSKVNGFYALAVREGGPAAILNIGGEIEQRRMVVGKPKSLTPHQWHHVAMTYDGKDLCLYLNGAQVASVHIERTRTAGRGGFCIGGTSYMTDYFRGVIDDVFLYDRALSAAEVQQRFSAATDPSLPQGLHPVASWNFEDLMEEAAAEQLIEKVRQQAGPLPTFRKQLGLE
jgi:hypothetical protein